MSMKSEERGVETVSSLCYSALNSNNWMSITPLPKKLQGRCKKVSVYDSCLLIKSHLDYEFSRTYSVNFFQELNFIQMFQLKLCCLSDDWPQSLHSSAEAFRETSFSFISFISFSILISVSLTESLNLPVWFRKHFYKLWRCHPLIAEDRRKQLIKYKFSKVITGEILKENTDAMSCERQFADSWLAGVQCTVASTAHSKYYSTGNFRTTIVVKLCWPVVNCVLRGTKAHRRKTESPWDRMISLSQDILTTVKYPVYEDATISTINLTV